MAALGGSWWKKDPEGGTGRAKKRWFVIKEGERLIQYFEGDGTGTGKGLKGAIELNAAEKVVCADPKLFIHTRAQGKARVWGLTAETPGQVERFVDIIAKVAPNVPIEGRTEIKTEDMAAMAASIVPTGKKDADGPSEAFADRVDVRAVVLQRDSKEDKYGVQFSPYEGHADGVMICGVTAGGPGDGLVIPGEKVVGINGHACTGKTYPEAVGLMRTVVNGTWSILKLDVQFRELWGEVTYEYEAQLDTELTLKMGQRVRIVSNEDNGWLRGSVDGVFGWFPSTYVELEPEPEIERYIPPPGEEQAALPKREGPFPELKIWNHGKINRQTQEDRAKAYSEDLSKGVFLARKKDANCYSVCLRTPDADGEPQIKFILFEKNTQYETWHADKSEDGLGSSVVEALEAHLQKLGYPAAEAIPKPE